MPDPHVNFAASLVAVAPSPAASGTSLSVVAGEGARFSTANFNAVVCPAGLSPTLANAEIVRVSNRSSDDFTIVRQQENTNPRTILVGDQIFQAITAKSFTDLESLNLAQNAWAKIISMQYGVDDAGLTCLPITVATNGLISHHRLIGIVFIPDDGGGNAPGQYVSYPVSLNQTGVGNFVLGVPTALPASGSFMGYGIEIGSDGNEYIVNGTQQVSAAAALSNIGGTLSNPNRLRMADLVISNSSGSYSLALSRDRRAFARGAYWYGQRNTPANIASATWTAIDTSNLQARIECTGQPVRCILSGEFQATVAGKGLQLQIAVDNNPSAQQEQNWFTTAASLREGFIVRNLYQPTPGSHLFTAMFASWDGTTSMTVGPTGVTTTMEIEEIVKPTARNGTS